MSNILIEKMVDRTRELIDSCMGSIQHNRGDDIKALGVTLCLTPEDKRAYMAGLLLSVAYELGRKDTRIEAFNNAAVCDESDGGP